MVHVRSSSRRKFLAVPPKVPCRSTIAGRGRVCWRQALLAAQAKGAAAPRHSGARARGGCQGHRGGPWRGICLPAVAPYPASA
eukprot:304150-Rhodomonas_salina.1